MGYGWDERKAQANLDKHGIDFADAVTALEDEHALSMLDPFSAAEDRYIAIGMDALGRVLVVVYAHQGEDIRLISARKAEPKEHRHYEGPP